ncbi:hypothetical protein PISMIDRAFT_412533 [Pisolithus microcarpus 441]|uniref:Uncharacterized protein n=1 Tax=Pisolithus microcarpus 441 TaxID=765257 RepID=A0A0C9ZEK2_9AGAM|nr:hypothetical protein BKA83DRAFT_412533 [Pisolithus microcarpus]KIK24344.1 hypothetical protein PISMIDRAFT_412533 [Pisolithus microcarpus 441]
MSAAQSRINTARKSKRRTASSPFSFSHDIDERLRLSPLRLSSVLMYILASYRDTHELAVVADYAMLVCWPAWKSTSRTTSGSTICRRNSKPGRTSHPVLVPAIVFGIRRSLTRGRTCGRVAASALQVLQMRRHHNLA